MSLIPEAPSRPATASDLTRRRADLDHDAVAIWATLAIVALTLTCVLGHVLLPL